MIDLDKFDKFFGPSGSIRKHVLSRLEHLRENKIIGKSLEAGVRLSYEGNSQWDFLWDSNLITESLNVSWVELTWVFSESEDTPTCGVMVWDLKKDDRFKACPRCFKYYLYKYGDGYIKEVYDDLCDRCLQVMLQEYADHPTMDGYFAQHPSLAHSRHIKIGEIPENSP